MKFVTVKVRYLIVLEFVEVQVQQMNVESAVEEVSKKENVIAQDKSLVVMANAQVLVLMFAVYVMDQVFHLLQVYAIATDINSIVIKCATVQLLKMNAEIVTDQVLIGMLDFVTVQEMFLIIVEYAVEPDKIVLMIRATLCDKLNF